MRMSPRSRWGRRSAMVWSTAPTGTMSQTARGLVSFSASTASEAAPAAFSLTRSRTAFADLSNTTHSWPSRRRRRTMLAPIRPRPIIPNCIGLPPGDLVLGCCASGRPLELAIASDQRVGGAVVAKLWLVGALELRDDPLRKSLAQLHTPLIEGVDLPDRALGEDAMLVERNQFAHCGRRQGLQQQGVRRAVALKQPVRHEPIRGSLCLDLVGGLAEGQRLGLRKDVGNQHIVVPAKRI